MTALSAPEPDEGSAASSHEPSGWEPVITRPDPVSEQELEAWLDHLAGRTSRSTRRSIPIRTARRHRGKMS